MKARISCLIFLALVFVGFRLFQAYVVFFGNDNTPPINVDIRNGHPVVRAITAKHLNGEQTSVARSGIKQGDFILGVYWTNELVYSSYRRRPRRVGVPSPILVDRRF